MGSKNPAPMKITTENALPITTIVEVLIDHVQILERQAHDAKLLLKWAVDRKDKLDWELKGQPYLAREVYYLVRELCVREGCPITTKRIVDEFYRRGEGSPTGVRGNLSRLVSAGFLLRPKAGTYWPADILLRPSKRIVVK